MIRIKSGQSIADAIKKAPHGPLTIILEEGFYREKINIFRGDVTLIGEGSAVIDFDDRHGTIVDGKELNTGDSATFTVGAPNFRAVNITFQNSFDFPCWNEWNKNNPGSRIDTQAVAFRTVFGASNTLLTNCVFKGHQDTIYLDAGCHYFNNCKIYGCVDYIFGSGLALFEKCEICSNGEGYVTAPSTFDEDEIGFIFNACSFTSTGIEDGSVFLARPWHPAGSLNRKPMATFIDSEFQSHINRKLWTSMHSRTPQGIERKWLPEESRFKIEQKEQAAFLLEKAKILCQIS